MPQINNIAEWTTINPFALEPRTASSSSNNATLSPAQLFLGPPVHPSHHGLTYPPHGLKRDATLIKNL
jgi:hypothetical protein